jgi:inner membrane protein involved in colicin E2 resistance
LTAARNALIGTEPLKTAQKQYEEARQLAQITQSKIAAKLQELSSQEVAMSPDVAKQPLQFSPIAESPSSNAQRQQLQQSFSQVEKLIDELDLRLGILQAQQGETDAAN